MSAHGPLSFAAEENRQPARELDAYLQSHEHPPLLGCAISLAVGAVSADELERRVELLAHQFGTVSLYRPLGLQPALFLDHLPRADGGTVRDYADVSTIEQFGALMPIGTHQAGSERGVYLGRTVSGGCGRSSSTSPRPPGRAAAVDPARRHARVGQDDRRRAARVPGRAARQPGGRRRPQARPQPRRAARARGPRARDRAVRGRALPRPARPAGRRPRRVARGPRELVPDRAAPAGAAGVGDPDPQSRPGRARDRAAVWPAGARAARRVSRPGRAGGRRGARGVGGVGDRRLAFGDAGRARVAAQRR